jgi:S-sulfo-L-cysteine synthase (3-phospho-L-serine-dependent)
MSDRPSLALVESNTTGSGRQFCEIARSRGLRPVVLVQESGRYPYLTQDRVDFITCDTADQSAVSAACRRLAASSGLAGVTSSSEYFTAMAARTAAEFGLPGASAEALSRCRHKDHQRRALAAAGVASPRSAVAETAAQAREGALRIGLPVVVKPTTGSGSAGVRLCRDPAEVEWWARHLLAMTANERGIEIPRAILVEEYVRGPEFSVEMFAGQVISVVGKHLSGSPYFVETGHDCPASLTASEDAAVREAACRAVAALGVGWGATHTELRMTDRGPLIIEVNPRLAGGMIPSLIELTAGVNLVDRVIAHCTGQPYAPLRRRGKHASIRFLLAPAEGVLASVTGLDQGRALGGVHALRLTHPVGSPVTISHSFRDRLGYAIAVGPDAATAADRAERALRHVTVTVRPFAVARPLGPGRAGGAVSAVETDVHAWLALHSRLYPPA